MLPHWPVTLEPHPNDHFSGECRVIRILPSLLKRLAQLGYLDIERVSESSDVEDAEVHASLDSIADLLIERRQAPVSGEIEYDTPKDAMEACLARFNDHDLTSEERDILKQMRPWAAETYTRLAPAFALRKQQGFGGQRLGIARSDVAADVAGIAAECLSYDQLRSANLIVDRYLEITGDFDMLRVLAYFIAYECLRKAESVMDDPESRVAYLREAGWLSEFRVPYLLIGTGVSGSGKSEFTYSAMRELGGIRVRSTVERARLVGKPTANTPEDHTDEITDKTYRRIARITGTLLESGYPVYIDATCMTREQRYILRNEAQARGLAVMIVSFEADTDTLEARLTHRQKKRGQPPQAALDVLHEQQAQFEKFTEEELFHLVHIDTTAKDANQQLVALIRDNLRPEVAYG